MQWHKFFIPHRDTHQKAHLISWEALAVYVLLFMLLQVGFQVLGFFKPGILGISSNISQQELIRLTNEKRLEAGLSPLQESPSLKGAAVAKASNMFEENYWAHFSPSGRDPWEFILGSGYKFTFAGENLAKNFQNSQDVVAAWIASPTHRDNILNPRYKDIGIAVVEGVLNGQKTTLVVQMFGTTDVLSIAGNNSRTAQINVGDQQFTLGKQEYEEGQKLSSIPLNRLSSQNLGALIDPFRVSKTVGMVLVSLIFILLVIDLAVLKKRGVFRISSHHIAHMALLGTALAVISMANPGSIL